MKESFFNKLVKKDYNNNLEEVLSKKEFSEDVKNTLLSIVYKIENGYKDYSIVKRNTLEKEEYLEKLISIIDKCNKIDFIYGNSNLEEKIDKEKKEIICYPKEINILYYLSKMQKKEKIVTFLDESIEEAVSFLLNMGNDINFIEPLRDFNGFSWNVVTKDIKDLNINVIYQNMAYLVENNFLDKWTNSFKSIVDYFELFKSKIIDKYGKSIERKIIKYIIKLAILIKSFYDKDFEESIRKKYLVQRELYTEMENREEYIEKQVKLKKQKEKEIKRLDKIINDEKLLLCEYKKRNENIEKEEKIFSIKVLKKILKENRLELIKEINELNESLKPKAFLNKKEQIKAKIEYFEIDQSKSLDEQIYENIINLEKEIIKCMYVDILKSESKQELIENIYKYRYYCLLQITQEKNIFEVKELKKTLNKLTKLLIDKSIEHKVIHKISDNASINYGITRKIFLSKIILLEDMNIKVKFDKQKTIITIFDEEIEDSNIKISKLKDLSIKIKPNKKIKFFI